MPQIFDLSTFSIEISIEKYFPTKQKVRVTKLLHDAGYKNLAQLCAATENDLRSIPDFGQKRIKYVQDALEKFGLRLRVQR